MPLQNRVTPFGDIAALEGRGLLMGNRGILHDNARRIVHYAKLRRWIACRLEWKGIRRTVMTPHRYTELFFLDEVTAFAAGHRPCAECRREDFRRFCAVWARCFGDPSGADAIDLQLHGDRLLKPRVKKTYAADVARLPDGAFISEDGRAWLVRGKALLAWSQQGYETRRKRPPHRDVEVLTPRSAVAVLSAGYEAGFHPSSE
ncbi:MAG TPA: hypothetical protein VKT51_02540 [Candidatus Eremiobacteraceae bacterium]|nr:hypothetical protein [Candidatus Eremiobacteraceae bacterium]